MRLVMLGEMPEPSGGVATWCAEVCARLVDAGVAVDMFDTERGAEKRPPAGLASYTVIGTRSATNVVRLVASPGLLARFIAIFLRLLPRPGSWRALLAGALLAPSVAAASRADRVRLILAHHAGSRGMAALIAGRARKVPVVVVEHGSRFTHPGRLAAIDLARFVVERVDRVIVPSSHTRRAVLRVAQPRDIEVVPNGVDHRRFHPSAGQPGGGGGLTVLFVGHIHPRKGVDVLVRAIPHVECARPLRFRLVGRDSGEGRVIRELASQLGVEGRIDFVGPVAADALAELYRQADVLAFPTAWETEGFGLVAAEAMACGTPVVASRIGAIPEVVADGRAGLLFEPGNERDLAEKLNRILNDDATRRRLGAEAARLAMDFDWEETASAILRPPLDASASWGRDRFRRT